MGSKDIKGTISTILNQVGFLNFYGSMRRKLTKSQVAVLLYHRICPESDSWSLKPLTPEKFERQIEYFYNEFDIIAIEQLIEFLNHREPLPKKAVAITFDDGYKDNYDYAYPILKKYRAPATIFLTTGHIGTGKLFWWDMVRYMISQTTSDKLDLGYLGKYKLYKNSNDFNSASIIIEKLKRIPYNQKRHILEMMAQVLGVNIPIDAGKKLILSWEEIIEMSRNRITFGAHTVNHPELINMPLNEAKSEILQSKKDIERKIGAPVSLFSFPNGDSSPELINFIKEVGFLCAFF